MEKKKFKQLLLHRRKAAQQSFRLLLSRKSRDGISLRHFRGLMHQVNSSKCKRKLRRKKKHDWNETELIEKWYSCSAYREVYLMFRLLNTSASGFISMQEFYCIYDVLDMKWKLRDRNQYWFTRARSQFVASAASQVHRLVTSNFFEYFICEFIISFPVIPPESMDLTGRHIF